MALTIAQLATLKADILLNSDMNTQPMTSGGAFAIAALYNVVGLVDVWRTEAPVSAIYDAITWTNFTPVDSIPAINSLSGNGELLQYWCRQGIINIKQMNLQNMLIGRNSVDASKANLRAGLRDCVIAIPAGALGINVVAGGANGATVMIAMLRKATRYEALFAPTTATTGGIIGHLMTIEGAVTSDDVQAARES